MAYAGYNFYENPVGISIILFVGCLFLLFFGIDRASVFTDTIDFESSHLSIISTKKKEEVYFDETKEIEPFTDGGVRRLGILFHSGEEVVFLPKIDKDHFFTIVELVKQNIK